MMLTEAEKKIVCFTICNNFGHIDRPKWGKGINSMTTKAITNRALLDVVSEADMVEYCRGIDAELPNKCKSKDCPAWNRRKDDD